MSSRATRNLNDILMILSVMSGVLVFFAAVVGIMDSSWPVRMYFALIATAFDFIFVFELLGRISGLLKSSSGTSPHPSIETALSALSSLIPFIFVSGPFLLGWIQSDFSAAAVRGYWTSNTAFSWLGIFGFFRLLRLVRPFIYLPGRFKYKKAILLSLALLACFGVTGSILVESKLLPGYRKMLRDSRNELTVRVRQMSHDEMLAIGRANPDILAIDIDGKTLFTSRDASSVQPGYYDFFSAGPVGIWFTLFPVHKIRSVSEALVSGCACTLAFSLAFFSLAAKRRELRAKTEKMGNPELADLPVGKEELDGILGKAR